VAVLGIALATALVVASVAQVAAVVAAGPRAQAAADLAALAGAYEARELRARGWQLDAACELAVQVARQNGASSDCRAWPDGQVTVQAQVTVGRLTVTRSASAG
jgi:hypothetical protein